MLGSPFWLRCRLASASALQLLTWVVRRDFGFRWAWLIGAVACFAVGLFTSEVWFGWATEEDLQPNVDGLSTDEVMLAQLVTTILIVLVVWRMARQGRTVHHHPPTGSRPRAL